MFGKKVIGLLCVVMGGAQAYANYMMTGNGEAWNPTVALLMTLATGASFVGFATSRKVIHSRLRHFIIGSVASYFWFLILLLIFSAAKGLLSVTVMRLPDFILYGLPYMAPLVVLVWLGTVLMIAKTAESKEDVEIDNPTGVNVVH